jgi:hypothetical protein
MNKRRRDDIELVQPELLNRTSSREPLLLLLELQTRIGKRFCAEDELLPLLLTHGLLRRARRFPLEIRRLGGPAFTVVLDVAGPLVGEAKAEIARVSPYQALSQYMQDRLAETCPLPATPLNIQDRLAEAFEYSRRPRSTPSRRQKGGGEPETLNDDVKLQQGEVVAAPARTAANGSTELLMEAHQRCFLDLMSLLVWRTFAEGFVALRENGRIAEQLFGTLHEPKYSLITTGVEFTEGRHYWEVELLGDSQDYVFIGVTRPNLDPEGVYLGLNSSDGSFIGANCGHLYGNGKFYSDPAGCCIQGDRVGVLLDLNCGSLRFFKNGLEHGPGYPTGSLTAPLVAAVHMGSAGGRVRLPQGPKCM